MVTTNLYSHDRQHILMPQGTRILGAASKVSISGQRRLATTFNNAFMPDGYPVDFPKLAGLDQQGAAGLTGRVDTHWPKVIATAALVGAIGGLSQIGASGTSLGGIDAIRLGVGQQTGQESMQILNRALNILPTVTVYEGTRVRIWVQKNFQLPAYENHTVSPTL
jgi:type IV secretion system protein VirB10